MKISHDLYPFECQKLTSQLQKSYLDSLSEDFATRDRPHNLNPLPSHSAEELPSEWSPSSSAY